MSVRWSNLQTAVVTEETLRKALNDLPSELAEPEFHRSAVTPGMVMAICRSGAMSPKEARRWLNSDGITIFGGPKEVDEALATLREIAERAQ